MSMPVSTKTTPQVALEVMMRRNKEEADQLFLRAKELLSENRRIEVEMRQILTPPQSETPPGQSLPTVSSSMRPDPMGGLLHAADALTRSWKRRNKKNFKQLELDLITALERVMNGRP